MTNRQKYVVSATAVFKHCLAILEQRSAKYASQDKPFENFEASADEAETTVSQGIMIRFGDKKTRLKKALAELRETGQITEFSDESLEDTICDMINYLAILRVWIVSECGENYDDFLIKESKVHEPLPIQPSLPFEWPDGEEVEQITPPKNWFKEFIGR